MKASSNLQSSHIHIDNFDLKKPLIYFFVAKNFNMETKLNIYFLENTHKNKNPAKCQYWLLFCVGKSYIKTQQELVLKMEEVFVSII